MSLIEPTFLAAGEGDRYWVFDVRQTVKITGAQTGGSYMLLEFDGPEGSGAPPHTHEAEDEVFIVMSGGMRVGCGDASWDLAQGELVFLPRGIQHSYRITTDGFRGVQIVNPAGFEDFLAALGDITARPRTPDSITPDELRRVAEIGREHGYRIGPPPGPRP